MFLRPEQVVLRGNWDVLGLAGTGSYDYSVDEQFVAGGFSFPLLTAVPQRGGATYNIGLFGIVASGHAGFALGVGARALDELLALVPTKQRMGQFTPVADEQLFQHDFAMHDAALRAARAYVFDVFGAAEVDGARGRRAVARAAATHAPGDDVRDARRRRRGALRVHVGGYGRAAQRQHAAALLSRHPRGHAARLRRQQHAHRVHAGAAVSSPQ